MKFTKQSIEKIALPKKGKRLIVWDTELKGFGMRITPSGKMYIAQARVNNISRRVSLGKHGVITLQDARKKAQKELSKMLEGKDPAVEKKKKIAYSLTLREITAEYLEKRDLKESYRADIEKHLSRAFASWADRPVIEITREKILKRFAELSERSLAQANQAFRVLRAILNYARGAHRHNDKPIIVENPVAVLSETKVWNRVKARSGRIPTDRIGKAWNMLQELRAEPSNSIVGRTLADITAFLLLTGARWSEAAQLTWDRVDLEEAWWYLPDPKNRQPVKFPLSDIAKEILQSRERTNNYVFPARSGPGYISDPRGPMEKISQVAGVRVTAHDLRRTFRAIAGECQMELWKAKLLMNHRLNQDVTIGHYTETEDLRYLAPEVNLIAEWITQRAMIAAAGNVLTFPAQGGK
jgi:integrase